MVGIWEQTLMTETEVIINSQPLTPATINNEKRPQPISHSKNEDHNEDQGGNASTRSVLENRSR